MTGSPWCKLRGWLGVKNQNICLPSYLPACLFVCLPVCQSACMSVCLSVSLSACLFVCLPACRPVCRPACLFISRQRKDHPVILMVSSLPRTEAGHSWCLPFSATSGLLLIWLNVSFTEVVPTISGLPFDSTFLSELLSCWEGRSGGILESFYTSS